MQRKLNAVALLLMLSSSLSQTALARGNDVVITDGQGEQVTMKHGFFGRGTTVVKDRFGDGFGQKKGLLGTNQTEFNVLGNGFTSKKGIFGGSDIKGGTIFGDRIETKKGIFGRRTTYVNAGGTAGLIRNLWNGNKAPVQGAPGGNQIAPDVLNTPIPGAAPPAN
jgi:hypothetical protein